MAAGKWLFGKRTMFLFKQTNEPVVDGQAVLASGTRGNVEYGTVLTDANVAEYVEPIADPGSATAEDVADKVNELIAALIAAGLMDDGVS